MHGNGPRRPPLVSSALPALVRRFLLRRAGPARPLHSRNDPCLAGAEARPMVAADDAPPLLPLCLCDTARAGVRGLWNRAAGRDRPPRLSAETGSDRKRRPRSRRSEEHTSELQSLMRISYAVFCLKKKNTNI